MKKIAVSLVSVLALSTASVAAAQSLAEMNSFRAECMDDATRYCSNKFANPKGMVQCILDNSAKIKPGCKTIATVMGQKLNLQPATKPQ